MQADVTGLLLPLVAGSFLSVLTFGAAWLLWWSANGRRRERRFARVVDDPSKHTSTASIEGTTAFRSGKPQGRLQRLEQSLGALLPNRARLRLRLERAGLKLGSGHYLAIVLILALPLGFFLQLVAGLRLLPAAAGGLLLGLLLMHVFVGFLGRRRTEKFLKQLPDAIDIIVRSVRAGLPILEGIKVVEDEFPAPLGDEFRTIRNKVHFGATMEEALWDIGRRIDRAEFNFLIISIAVQRETGGNLTEALQNLSRILRQRAQMKLKVRALSSEARASAYILGALPFIMTVLIYVVNPEYLSKLFIDPRGHVLIGFGLGSISCGALVMGRMIRFEI
jgi:tight adherence protein B